MSVTRPKWVGIACEMLACTSDQIHPWLFKYLDEIDRDVKYVDKRGLDSVQVIAGAIQTWRRVNSEEKPVIRGR